MRPGGTVAALEGLRGYAAFLVFLVHAFGLLATRLHGIDPEHHDVWHDREPLRVLLVLLSRSHYGVDLFFVLSGLFMADLAVRRWPGTGAFLRRRWLRIYPAYLASTALFAVVTWAWLGRTYAAPEAAGNLALLQGFFVLDVPAINPVTWSLSYEAAFYLAVPAVAVLWRGATARRTAWLALCYCLIVAVSATIPAAKAIYLAYFALFIPGVAIGLAHPNEREALARSLPTAAALAMWVVFTLALKLGIVTNAVPAYYFLSGLAGGLLTLKACGREGWLATVLSRPLPCWLGRYSYSFFLTHYIVLHMWAAWLAARLSPEHRLSYALLYLAGGLALSLAAARAFWQVAEAFYFRSRRPSD